jgi:hypothetical protein
VNGYIFCYKINFRIILLVYILNSVIVKILFDLIMLSQACHRTYNGYETLSLTLKEKTGSSYLRYSGQYLDLLVTCNC